MQTTTNATAGRIFIHRLLWLVTRTEWSETALSETIGIRPASEVSAGRLTLALSITGPAPFKFSPGCLALNSDIAIGSAGSLRERAEAEVTVSVVITGLGNIEAI